MLYRYSVTEIISSNWENKIPLDVSLFLDNTLEKKKNLSFQPGTVAHACNLNTLGAQSRQIAGAQEFETSLVNIEKSRLYKRKNLN